MLQPEAENIEAAASERGITELIHFTWTSNLDSIFRLGLLSRNEMKDSNYRFTDGWGGYPSHISLSIMFPNYLMFVAKKMATTPEDGFCMLRINPCVMWSGPNVEQTLFCYTNMANTNAQRESIIDGCSADAFSRLFAPEVKV
ncbi:MAG: hypothetical protein HOJ54_10105, partial [Phycisphaerae bacterium]|nr:hypothetical protein [Phycisphaerae bacterium]